MTRREIETRLELLIGKTKGQRIVSKRTGRLKQQHKAR